MNAPVQPVHLHRPYRQKEEAWSVTEIEALLNLPFMDLLHRAASVHREHHDPNRVQLSTLLSITGQGFEKIIENDYTSLSDDNERMFVVLVGLGTIHRLPIRESIVSRALPHLKILDTTETLLKITSGIVSCTDGNLYARHPIYIERLFEVAVTKEEKHSAICAILNAFSVYNKPLLASVGRSSRTVFKWIVNHGFLKNTLSGAMSLVLSIYESFAKAYEVDGLYWLQYGLALRDSGMQEPALEKLRIARDIYPIKQTEHAYAQQLFIIADETTSPYHLSYFNWDEIQIFMNYFISCLNQGVKIQIF